MITHSRPRSSQKRTIQSRLAALLGKPVWPNPANARSFVTYGGGDWAHQHIRQVLADDRFDAVFLVTVDGSPQLDTVPVKFIGLCDFYNEHDGRLVLVMQDLVPLEMTQECSPFIPDLDNYVGCVPRGSDPMERLHELDLTSKASDELNRAAAGRA